MKKFGEKLTFFLIGLVILLIGCVLLSARNDDFSIFFGKITNSSDYSRYKGSTGTVEINPSIDRVKEKNQYTKLIIGDSVCYQIYNNLQTINTEYCIVGTNRAITLSGQYLLANEFIENHDKITDIYLIVTLDSLDSYFDKSFGYQYAVMPFVEKDIFDKLDDNTINIAEKSYGKFFIQKDVVELIDYSEMNRKIYLNAIKMYSNISDDLEGHVSDQSIRYITKLNQLCEKQNINFYLLPTPIMDSEENRNQIIRQKKEFENAGMAEYVEEYYSNIIFYPSEQFRDDIHLGGSYTEREQLNRKINDLREKSQKLEDLVIESKE